MYLAQVPKTPGIRLTGIADLAPDNAKANLARVGWPAELVQRTPISDDWRKWLPHFAQSTPETVWGYYGLTPEQAKIGGLNPKMFNSFLDGSKPAIETTAVCNATGLTPAPEGLAYPPGSVDEIPSLMRPRAEGGVLHHKGQVEVISSLRHDGTPIPYDIRFGVFVVFEGETEYIQRCFSEYGVKTD